MAEARVGPQAGGESADHRLSLREFARRLGINEKAVRKARDAGRLANCLGKDGRVLDFDRAALAFAKSSRTGVGVRTDGPQTPAPGPQPATDGARAPAGAPTLQDVIHPGEVVSASTLFEAQRIATLERARKLKLENDATEKRLLPLDDAKKEAFEAERIIRENILNLPARIAGELAAETDAGRIYIRLDLALREALNTTADALLAVNG